MNEFISSVALRYGREAALFADLWLQTRMIQQYMAKAEADEDLIEGVSHGLSSMMKSVGTRVDLPLRQMQKIIGESEDVFKKYCSTIH